MQHPSSKYIEKVQHKKFPLANKYKKRNRLILNKHSCMLQQEPKCDECEGVKLTVEHIVMECKKYETDRNILRSAYCEEGIQFSLKNILDVFPAHELMSRNLEFINSMENI